MANSLDTYFEQEPKNVLVLDTLEKIFNLPANITEEGYFFRGVSNASYGLKTSLERSNRFMGSERFLMEEFDRGKHEYLSTEQYPRNKFESLALMQHYGVPTRLLDFTKSPFVALYFAVNNYFVENRESRKVDGAVYALMHHNLHAASTHLIREKLPDLDLSRLPFLLKHNSKVFEDVFFNPHFSPAFLLEPYNLNKRLSVQQGLFLVSNFNKSLEDTLFKLIGIEPENFPLDDFHDSSLLKLIIPYELKKDVLKRLFMMNINAATLFPGLDGYSQHIKERNELVEMNFYFFDRY